MLLFAGLERPSGHRKTGSGCELEAPDSWSREEVLPLGRRSVTPREGFVVLRDDNADDSGRRRAERNVMPQLCCCGSGWARKGGAGPFLWTWDEGDFNKVEKPLEGLWLKRCSCLFREHPPAAVPWSCAQWEPRGARC